MTDATTASSSSANNIEDILRVIAPYDRDAFRERLKYELQRRGGITADEVRRVAEQT